MWHYGETVGFRTTIQRFVDDKLTIIILCNRDDLVPANLALKSRRSFSSRAALKLQSCSKIQKLPRSAGILPAVPRASRPRSGEKEHAVQS